MQPIVQSYFLQALAYALINSIWQMGLLWLAIIFIFHVLKLSSSQKFTIAFIVQLSGFILFLYVLINSYTGENSFQILKSANIIYAGNAANYFKYVMPFASVIYILILVWHILKLMLNYKFTQDLRKNNLAKISAVNRVFVEELETIFSLHKKVKIYLSKTIKCPVTIGFFKPVILIPLAAINYLTKEQMEAVILHEMAHIKRADYLLNLLQYVIRKVFFFNIFSKMMDDIIERERENACDDWVVQFKYNSFHYAEALLKIAKLQSLPFAMAASGKNEHILFNRVKRLIHTDKNISYQYTSLRFSFFASIIALGLIISFSSKNAGIEDYSPVLPQSLSASEKIIDKNPENNNSASPKKIPEKNNVETTLQVKRDFLNRENKKAVVTTSENSGNTKQPASDLPQKQNLNFVVSTNQTIDSLKQTAYSQALNKQFTINKDVYKKALSYQNFKQLEAMLVLTGDSVNVIEDSNTKDNYKKLITIETTDKNGNTNIYQVIVELYQ